MDLFEDEDGNILKSMNEKRNKKSFAQLINRRKLSGFEMDDLFTEE